MKTLKEEGNELVMENVQTQYEINNKKLIEFRTKLESVAGWLPDFMSEEEKVSLILKTVRGTEEEGMEFIHELVNGKWKFMKCVDLFRKKNSGCPFYAAVEEFNVERVDVALPEIQQRLNCEVFKVWQRKAGFFLNKANEDCPNLKDKTLRRIGWSIDLTTVNEKKKIGND